MATYAIGDIQGCFDSLLQLLDKINFDPLHDRLWFTGDLVNRGPKSLEVLRFIKKLKSSHVVLGNHDLYLLSVVYTGMDLNPKNNLQAILNAPDLEELCIWLRNRSLLHHDAILGYTLVHAGFPPEWDLDKACDWWPSIPSSPKSARVTWASNWSTWTRCWPRAISSRFTFPRPRRPRTSWTPRRWPRPNRACASSTWPAAASSTKPTWPTRYATDTSRVPRSTSSKRNRPPSHRSFELPSVVVVPHLGASTFEAQDKAGITIAEQVQLALAGDFVPYAVNVAAGEVSQRRASLHGSGRSPRAFHRRSLDGKPADLEVNLPG